MSGDLVADALTAMGLITTQDPVRVDASQSEADVYRVRLGTRDAILKVTSATAGRTQARRELTFYASVAATAPIRTASLIGSADTDELTAIALTEHTPLPPAREWDLTTWLTATRQLAALHSMPVPHHECWSHVPWLRQVLDRPPVETALAFWSKTEAAGLAKAVLATPENIAVGLRATPDCFVHGDCHADNLVADGHNLVWIDWQSTGVGAPAGDLAFLWFRALADRADPPRGPMLDEYFAHCEIDRSEFARSVLTHELGTILFGWPAFAWFHAREEQDLVTRHLVKLAPDWLALA